MTAATATFESMQSIQTRPKCPTSSMMQVAKLKQDVDAERAGRTKLREEVEGERERVKKAITEFKRKTER